MSTVSGDSGTVVDRRQFLQGVGAGVIGGALLSGRVSAEHDDGEEWTAWGAPVEIGDAKVRTYTTFDGDGLPVVLGVWLPEKTMRYLPNRTTEWHLALPRALTKKGTPFTFAGVDWNPAGHEPAFYETPHFDFHFYLLAEADVEAIAPGVAAYDLPAERFPDGYVFAPGREIVPEMGEHLVDPTAPEFNGETFTETFIWGAYAPNGRVDEETGTFGVGETGQTTFLEPMVDRAYLETRPSVRKAIKTPTGFVEEGYYPTTYGIAYKRTNDVFLVTLEDFEWFDAV